MTNHVTNIYDSPLLSLFAIAILCYKGEVPALNFVSDSLPISQYSRPLSDPESRRKVPVCLSGERAKFHSWKISCSIQTADVNHLGCTVAF